MIDRVWRRWPRRAEGVFLVLVIAVTAVEALAAGPIGPGEAVAVLVAVGALLLRRRRPVISLVIVTVAGLALTIIGHFPVITPLVVLAYSIAAHGRLLTALAGGATSYLVLVAASLLAGRPPGANLTAPLALALALAVGWTARSRRRYTAAMAEKAGRDLELAAAAERDHIARELHDVIAHSLSVMVRLADGALAVASADPEASRAAIGSVSRVGRDALTDMRGLLGAIASTDSPLPRLDDLGRLVEDSRLAGLPVSLEVQGVAEVSEGIQLLIYRIVQESLTNALRYSAAPTEVAVRVSRERDRLTVDVSDDGEGHRASEMAGSGRGLAGLGARVEMYGGSLTAGPGAPTGWTVHASVPIAELPTA